LEVIEYGIRFHRFGKISGPGPAADALGQYDHQERFTHMRFRVWLVRCNRVRSQHYSSVTSTTVSRSTPTHASSRTLPTLISTLPRGASTEAVPSWPVTAEVPPQPKPQPRIIIR